MLTEIDISDFCETHFSSLFGCLCTFNGLEWPHIFQADILITDIRTIEF